MPAITVGLAALIASMGLVALAQAGPAQGGGRQFTCQERTATIIGSNGSEVLSGTSAGDVIVGLGRDDTINGGGGADLICGDADQPSGIPGRDRLNGGSGRDSLAGGFGDDLLIGRSGGDRMDGGSGRDRFIGGPGRDRLLGRSGNDVMMGDSGNDRLDGGADDDRCDGSDGTDSGVRCELDMDTSIAILRFGPVSLRRQPPGASTCDLGVTVFNDGSEAAQDVEVDTEVKSIAGFGWAIEDDMEGAAVIAVDDDRFYRSTFFFPQGDVVNYFVSLRNGGNPVATVRSDFGIPCSG